MALVTDHRQLAPLQLDSQITRREIRHIEFDEIFVLSLRDVRGPG
jgi:hypothetical protein